MLSSGSEVGGVKPVLCQKLSKILVSMFCSKASAMSMSTTAEDVWHSVKMINEAGIIAVRFTCIQARIGQSDRECH